MATMRESWTDERLDAFRAEVGHRFDEVDRRFDFIDRRFEQVDLCFEQVDRRFEEAGKRLDRVEGEIRLLRSETKAGFDVLNERFDRLYRIAIGSATGVIAALIGLVATQV